ncbi:MAG: glycosyltransferase family 2 protein, partial [Actinomycetota bacterium]|nr:glycosyltransferase family 2 protein [Actinomycetota bacterium]
MSIETNLAPPVVAVLVTEAPGEWFDEVLDGLVGQDYENFRVLAIDRGDEPVESRVLNKIPDAVVAQATDSKGFGDAANKVRTLVEGCTFYLFLHDDVALAPDAVSLLVAEALESNAGILGPKILRWDDPSRILEMGGTIDAFGVLTPYVESGELDQQQHDRVRDAFVVSSVAMLVRVDLFETIEGFDPRIKSIGEDVDLCWRAQLAGGRVLVVPDAVARHGIRVPPEESERIRRHAIRHRHHVIAKCYGWIFLVPVMFGAVLLSFLEFMYSFLVARFSQARDIAWAWGWNVCQIPYVLSCRRRIARTREMRDKEVRRRQSPGSTRLKSFLQGRIGGEVALQTLRGRAGRRIADTFMAGPRRTALLTWAILMSVLAFGSRHLLTRGVPAYGQFAHFPDASSLLSEYWNGWREIGVGVAGIGPAALGLL